MSCYYPVEICANTAEPGELKELQMRRVPCGLCLGCRTEQARQWAVRMVHESTMHPFSWFVTLTYDNESIPENGSLDPRDPWAFIRRVRRHYGKGLSYYLCGEYGDTYGRPHYHAVLYGPDFPDRVVSERASSVRNWTSNFLDELWGRGRTEFSTVSFGSASYVAQYVRKKVDALRNPGWYDRVDPETGNVVQVHPEFARMSRRPAIGRRWIERWWRDVYPRDFVVMDGHESRPPRYYDRWLQDHHPEVWNDVRRSRVEMPYAEWCERNRKEHDGRADYHRNAKKVRHESRNRLFSQRGEV